MEIAITVEGQSGLNWPRWKRLVRHVEDLGFAGLYRSDHFTNASAVDSDALELWVSLTWQADHSRRQALGPLVSPVSFRHPAHTVRMAAAVDDLSGGRLVLGLGAGWQAREHRMFGFPWLDPQARFERFDEALEIVYRMLRSTRPLTFTGRHYAFEDAVLLPRPMRPGGPPILLGGNSVRRLLPLAAVYADEWNAVWVTPPRFTELSVRLDALLDAAGRRRHEVRRSLMHGIVYASDRRGLEARLAARSRTAEQLRGQGMVVGVGAEIRPQLDAFAAAGVECLMLQWLDLDDLDGLEHLAATARQRSVRSATRPVPLGSGIREAHEAAEARPDVINLSLGQPDLDTPEPIKRAAQAAIEQGFNRYTPTPGLPEVRQAIAARLQQDVGLTYEPLAEIMVTAGAINGLSLALGALLQSNDEVLVTDPAYPTYESCVWVAGGVPVRVPLAPETGFRLDLQRLEAAITGRTRVLLLNSPNNPTGVVLSNEELEGVAHLARQHDLTVISDEVYEKIVYQEPHVSIACIGDMRHRTVVVNSFSKTCLVCGWRIGFVAAPAPVVQRMIRLQQVQVVSAPSVAQRAMLVALESQDWVAGMVAEYRRRRQFMVERLQAIPGVSCRSPQGAFYVFPEVAALGTSQQIADQLQTAGVMTVRGTAFGRQAEGYLRLSFARPMAVLEHAMDRIEVSLRAAGSARVAPETR